MQLRTLPFFYNDVVNDIDVHRHGNTLTFQYNGEAALLHIEWLSTVTIEENAGVKFVMQ